MSETIPAEELPEVPTEVFGIDVSKHQGPIDWPKVAASGVSYAMIRASCGRNEDARFKSNWKGARAAGLIVGAYHYFEAPPVHPLAADAYTQSMTFLAALAGARQTAAGRAEPMLPPVLDAEEGRPSADDLNEWLEGAEGVLELCPWIYTCIGWWSEAIGNDMRFARYPLWAADYTPPLDIPKPWTDVVTWQKTAKGRVPGIQTAVDTNTFYGSLETLRWMARS